jgi:alpha-1,6-mannosyltransferase
LFLAALWGTVPAAVKVLDVTDFYSERGGGIRSHLAAKGRALRALGIDHVTLAPGPSDSDEPLDASVVDRQSSTGLARVVRVRGMRQPYDPTYHFLSRTKQASAIILAERPDVIELNSLYLAALTVRRVPREIGPVRTAFWHSDHIDTFLTPVLQRWGGAGVARGGAAPFWAATRALLARCDATVCASRWQRDKLESHGIPRVRYVPFGVDKRVFTPNARDPELRRALIGDAPPEARLIVGVGRLSMEKRWRLVLEAFFRVREQVPAVLVLFGDGPERAALEALAAGRTDVRFAGFVSSREELARSLASADLLIHGCPFETFGLGIAEAVACGLPVVVPDRGGASESVSGASAGVYPAEDVGACAAAISRLLKLPQPELHEATRAAAERVSTTAAHFSRVSELYRELLAEKQAQG